MNVDTSYIKSCDWEKIYSYLKKEKRVRVGNEEKTRVFLEGVYFIMRTGAQWRELPNYYGKWRSVHKPFEFWSRIGVWSDILLFFTKGYDGESIMIDSTIVWSHPCAAVYERGKEKKKVWDAVKVALRQKFMWWLMRWVRLCDFA